jgi:hypothetical protein
VENFSESAGISEGKGNMTKIVNGLIANPAVVFAMALALFCAGCTFFGMAYHGKTGRTWRKLAFTAYFLMLLLLSVTISAYGISTLFRALAGFLCLIPFGILVRWQHRIHAHWRSSFLIVVIVGLILVILPVLLGTGRLGFVDLVAYVAGGIFGVACGHSFINR